MSLRDVTLVDAAVSEDATLGDAASALFTASIPALAVLDAGGKVTGIFSEADLLKAVFPGYLSEVKHTAFLRDDASSLAELATLARDKCVREFARKSEVLQLDDSKIHAAERFIHTGEDALPVVDGERFAGMVSIAALCFARLARAGESA